VRFRRDHRARAVDRAPRHGVGHHAQRDLGDARDHGRLALRCFGLHGQTLSRLRAEWSRLRRRIRGTPTMLVLSPDRRIAERLEDLASRLDAGLPTGEARHGQAVAEAIARNLALRPFEVAALQAGETAGRLPSVLRHLAAARHATAAWKGEVARAL